MDINNQEIDKISSEENEKQPVVKEIERPAAAPIMQMITSKKSRINLVRTRVTKDPKKFNPQNCEALYKVVLIGDSGVGKTSLLLRFTEDVFNATPLQTIGVDFKIKTMKIDDKIVKV